MLVRMRTACIYIAILLVLLKIGALYAVKCGSGLPPCPDRHCCKITCTHYNIGDCVSVQAADCTDVRNAGCDTSGVYQVATWSTNTSIQVYCDMETDGGGWTVFQRRIDGSLDFSRNWTEYVYGFGAVDDEYWLGLSLIREMADRGTTQLRITVTDVNDILLQQQFGNFSVTTESYILNFGAQISGDSIPLRPYTFMYHNGMAFTTNDMDNDDNGANCASISGGGGWWHCDCYAAHLNGVYTTPGTISANSAGWYQGILHSGLATTTWCAFKTSSMMLRQNN